MADLWHWAFPTWWALDVLWDIRQSSRYGWEPMGRLKWAVTVTIAVGVAFCAITDWGFHQDPEGLVWAAAAALEGYRAWKTRPPRKRRESKVLGRIRDMGHRLVVTNDGPL